MPLIPVTLIAGDGIGPEVVGATKRVLDAAGAPIDWEPVEAGAKVFKQGLASGVPRATIDSILQTGVVLKGPLETPVGYGEKSANVTLRKLFEMYANVRPVRELPNVSTPYSGRGIDLVVVRENIEDLYAGIEHMQTPTCAQSLKIITRLGSAKVIRLAYELARAEGRSGLHCAHKANILKLTQGLFKRTFEELAADYPDLKAQTIIVDNCAHQLVLRPERFEIIVTTNLAGDILSDLTAGLVGGLGVAPAANIGHEVSMFEPVHGSAPDIAGQGLANPTAMLLSAVLMLRHIGLGEHAELVENAVLVTLEKGDRLTADLIGPGGASTAAFADAVVANLGRRSERWPARRVHPFVVPSGSAGLPDTPVARETVGADLFIEHQGEAEVLGRHIDGLLVDAPLRLKMISNRGSMVYPPTGGITELADVWRCRLIMRDPGTEMSDAALWRTVETVGQHYRWMHIEKLQRFDGEPAYTRAQGED